MKQNTYGIGIIGYGGFGRFLHHHWDRLETVEVVALCDMRLEPLNGLPSIYSDPADLLADDRVKIVSIATPPSTHPELAIQAMLAGKHVLLEKPAALDVQQVEALFSIRDRAGVRLMTDYMLRFNPLVEALKSVVSSKIFGELRYAKVTNIAQDSSLHMDHWFWDRAISGGIFIEHAVHFFDLLYYLSGSRVQKVTGLVSPRNQVQQDKVFAAVRHENGLIASHYHAFIRPGFFEETTIECIFDIATISVSGWIPLSGHIKALVDPDTAGRLKTVLPNFRHSTMESLESLEDISRPAGWGKEQTEIADIRASGSSFKVSHLLTGDFALDQPKSEVYGHCVRQALLDLIRWVIDPGYNPVINDDSILESIRIAQQAAESTGK